MAENTPEQSLERLPSSISKQVLTDWYNKNPEEKRKRVLKNLVGEQSGIIVLGIVRIQFYVETDVQLIRLVTTLGASSHVADGSRGAINITDGDTSINIQFEVRTTGLYMNGTLQAKTGSVDIDGYALYWPEPLTLEPGLAKVISKPRDDVFPGRSYINAALRDPSTLKTAGLAFTKSVFTAGMVADFHMHLNDTVRIVVSGHFRFSLDDGTSFEAKAGDVVNIPGGTYYKEEVLADAVVVTSRFARGFHYNDPK